MVYLILFVFYLSFSNVKCGFFSTGWQQFPTKKLKLFLLLFSKIKFQLIILLRHWQPQKVIATIFPFFLVSKQQPLVESQSPPQQHCHLILTITAFLSLSLFSTFFTFFTSEHRAEHRAHSFSLTTTTIPTFCCPPRLLLFSLVLSIFVSSLSLSFSFLLDHLYSAHGAQSFFSHSQYIFFGVSDLLLLLLLSDDRQTTSRQTASEKCFILCSWSVFQLFLLLKILIKIAAV